MKGSMPKTLRDAEMFKAASYPGINISLLYVFFPF